MAAVLIVDDEPDIMRTMKRFLEREGHDVVMANDGLEALALMNDASVDAAFIDIVMPKVDGLTVMRRMVQDHPHVRVIVMSAFEDVIDLPEREIGLVRALKKPFGLDEVKAALDLALGKGDDRLPQ